MPEEFFLDIKNFKYDEFKVNKINILFDEEDAGIHAEVQVLTDFVQ